MAGRGIVEVEGGKRVVPAPWRRRRAARSAPARRAGRGPRLHAPAGRAALRAPAGDRLRPARVRPLGDARRHVALDRRPVCDRGRPGARRARARPLPPARPVMGRMARDRLHGPRSRAGIAGLVLASTSASIAEFVAGARGLIDELPEPHRTALTELGARGEYDHPDYRAGEQEFYRRHLCRLDPWPDALVRSSTQMEGNQVYATMNGPTEFDVIGTLRTWDRHRRPGPDRRADACHVRALRRDHAGLLRDDRRGNPRRPDGRVRGERARRPPRGARGVRRGPWRSSWCRPRPAPPRRSAGSWA